MDDAGSHHALRRGKEAITAPRRNPQDIEKHDIEKAKVTVSWQTLLCL